MSPELLNALKEYIDRKIEAEFAERETGADGYMASTGAATRAAELAWTEVLRISNTP